MVNLIVVFAGEILESKQKPNTEYNINQTKNLYLNFYYNTVL